MSKCGTFVLRSTALAIAVVLGVSGLAACDPGPTPQAPIHVNFAPEGQTPPAGYVNDSGAAYDDTRGYGWISQTDATPLSILGNARDRNKVTDQRYDTFIQPQGGSPVATPARWKTKVQNGVYDVTVAVGDVGTVTGSTHRITAVSGATSVAVINNFVSGTANKTATVTERLRVLDGTLTLDAAGGTNTKLDYVDIVPVTNVVSAGTTIARINFAAASNAVPHRYTNDTGSAYTASRGYGWISQTDSTPLSIVGDGRDRNNTTIADQRIDTFVAMQNTDSAFGPTTPARWQYGVASGTYDVTVSVGDPNNTPAGSTQRIAAEGTVLIDNFKPTAAKQFKVATMRVTVSDGFLTLDAAGGTNTKINYVDIIAADTNARTITSVDPSNGATNVPLDTSVALSPSAAVNPDTVNATTVQLLDPSSVQVDGVYNSDAAGGVVIFTPGEELLPNTTYTVQTTSGLQDTDGNPYEPFTSTFTTGTSSSPPSPVNFDKSVQADLTGPTSMVIGPDGKLYVGNGIGEVRRYPILAGGALGTPDVITPFPAFSRTITGLAFQPGSTASNLRLWVSHGELGNRNMANFTGKVTLLTGANLDTVQDKITGLPRSVKDHMNNGIVFGPDGKLYIAQGAMNGYGGPDQNWGFRAETPMSASILVADVVNDARFGGANSVNVNTDTGYDPAPVSAPVRVYAQGTRNPFDLVWANDGNLYAPVNESSAGDTPAGPHGNDPVPLSDLPAGRDYLAKVMQGKYYGHPNPAQNHYVLNGGNPTSAADPFETPQYPVGTQPDPNYQQPLADLGLHRSADGIDQYTSNVFGSTLRNKLIFAEYSNGDDIVAIDPNNPSDKFQIASGLFNPLDVRADPVTGNVYVAEYGSDPDGTGGHITLLTPAPDSTRTPYARVDFTTKGATVPSGYNRDSGQGYNAARGFGWVAPGTQTPADLTAQGRERNINSNKLLDTFIQMQQPPTGNWQIAVPNGSYDVTVAVGDAGNAVDSTHTISAESTVVIPPFTPTSTDKFRTATARVDVSDGFLTLSAPGGTNTKIDYVDIDTITTTGTPPADTTNPNVELTTTGTSGTPPNFTSAVTVTATATDIGSGVSSVSYTLDGGPSTPYSGPISVTTAGNHTVVVTAKDGANNTGSATSTFSITPPANSAALKVTGEADVLGLSSRIIFSTAQKAATPAKSVTITNTGTSNLTVSNVTIGGTNPGQFALNTGQATSFTVAPNATATVSVLFKPNSLGVKFATVTIASNDPLVPNYSVAIRGVNAGGTSGDTEPTLTDLMNTFGYSTNTGITDVFQATTRSPVGDEVIAPNFVRVDSSKPVSLVPIARYVAATTFTSDTGRTAKNSSAKVQMYKFPADTLDSNPDDGVDTTVFAQNQKVFPQITAGGTTTFTPTAAFGLDANFTTYSDDQFNLADDGSGYRFHNVRVWPAKGPDGVQIPNTWLVGVDVNKSADKNFDYQDQLMLLSNATPELTAAVGPNTPATILDFNSPRAGTILDKDGEGTGFTSVQVNKTNTQYKPANIDLTGGRLRLTSTVGKNSGTSNDQDNALQVSFDASRSNFTEQARIMNAAANLTAGFQQKSMYFGPDQDNYLKVEIEHRTDTPGIFITVFLEQAHVTSTIGQVQLTSPPANYLTLDFQISGDMENGRLQAAYRVNSSTNAFTPLGTAFQPANIFQWFSPQARAGILVSHTGSTTPIVGVYDSFQVI